MPVSNQASYAEDAPHRTGDAGSFVLGVRNDTGATLSSTDLDYSPVAVDFTGATYVNPGESTEGQRWGLRFEDNAHSTGERGVFILGVRNDADASRTSADGDYSPISVDSAGRAKVVVSAGTNEIGRVGSKLFNGTLKDNSGDDVEVKSASVSFATSGNGNNTVQAAVASKKIRVVGIWGYIADAASHIALLQDGAGGTTLFALKVSNGTETYNFAATAGTWLFETTANTLLNLNLTQNVDSGFIRFSYIEVD